MGVGLSYRVPPAAMSRELIARPTCDCVTCFVRKLPRALPEASSGASPSHHGLIKFVLRTPYLIGQKSGDKEGSGGEEGYIKAGRYGGRFGRRGRRNVTEL